MTDGECVEQLFEVRAVEGRAFTVDGPARVDVVKPRVDMIVTIILKKHGRAVQFLRRTRIDVVE